MNTEFILNKPQMYLYKLKKSTFNLKHKAGHVRLINTEPRSCSHCRSERAVSITNSESAYL